MGRQVDVLVRVADENVLRLLEPDQDFEGAVSTYWR
jgi:hypothetical protein